VAAPFPHFLFLSRPEDGARLFSSFPVPFSEGSAARIVDPALVLPPVSRGFPPPEAQTVLVFWFFFFYVCYPLPLFLKKPIETAARAYKLSTPNLYPIFFFANLSPVNDAIFYSFSLGTFPPSPSVRPSRIVPEVTLCSLKPYSLPVHPCLFLLLLSSLARTLGG